MSVVGYPLSYRMVLAIFQSILSAPNFAPSTARFNVPEIETGDGHDNWMCCKVGLGDRSGAES